MKRISILLLVLVSITAYAEVDQFNTYRYNRKNVLRENGEADMRPWFEWWYYKIVIPNTGENYFFCYGVVNPWDTDNTMRGTRSVVAIGDFNRKFIIEKHLPVNDFEASYSETYVAIRDNVATEKRIIGDVEKDGVRYKWDINYNKRWTYNPVGWLLGYGVTNIEWYVAQADARCTGTVERNGEPTTFENVPCYQDRNWGRSFPAWWTWIVSNHFKGHPDTTISIGGGWPKVLNRLTSVKGVSIGLNHKGKEYLWRPNYFARVKMDVNFGKWEVEATNGTHKIEVSAWAPREEFMDLEFMTPDGEIFHDYETLTGTMTVKLYKRIRVGVFEREWKLIDILESDFAGIEYGSPNVYEFDGFFGGKASLQ